MESKTKIPSKKCDDCKVFKKMFWDNQFCCFSSSCKKCSKSQPISEYNEIRCSSCKITQQGNMFMTNEPDEYFKTCIKCRTSKKKYRYNKKMKEREKEIGKTPLGCSYHKVAED
jgi:hypothetical protein